MVPSQILMQLIMNGLEQMPREEEKNVVIIFKFSWLRE